MNDGILCENKHIFISNMITEIKIKIREFFGSASFWKFILIFCIVHWCIILVNHLGSSCLYPAKIMICPEIMKTTSKNAIINVTVFALSATQPWITKLLQFLGDDFHSDHRNLCMMFVRYLSQKNKPWSGEFLFVCYWLCYRYWFR